MLMARNIAITNGIRKGISMIDVYKFTDYKSVLNQKPIKPLKSVIGIYVQIPRMSCPLVFQKDYMGDVQCEMDLCPF
jgi:hypothetical protein